MKRSYAIEIERTGMPAMRLEAADAATANEAAHLLKAGCPDAIVRVQGHPDGDPLRRVWLTVVTQSIADVL